MIEGVEDASDLPHTITLAVTYRTRLNSFYELPRDKQPPRNLWDKPFKLKEFFDDVFDVKGGKPKHTTYVEYDPEEVE